MASTYTFHKELFPPQTVEHVERARFISADAINLIIAKDNILQIYEFVEYIPEMSKEEEEEETENNINDKESFEHDQDQV
jgi:cleavage and polyadenylation specificity factor subunit 1